MKTNKNTQVNLECQKVDKNTYGIFKETTIKQIAILEFNDKAINTLPTEKDAFSFAELFTAAPELLHLLNEVITNTRLSSSIEDSEIVGYCKEFIKKLN